MLKEEFELFRVLRNDNKDCFLENLIITQEQQCIFYNKYVNDSDSYFFSIFHECYGWIGGCSLYNVNKKEKKCEFGRFIIDKHKTNGEKFGSTIVRLILLIALVNLNITTVYLNVFENNIPAIKTYLKSGFRYESSHNNKFSKILKFINYL